MNIDLICEIDDTIKVVCEKIKEGDRGSGTLPERVKALAALIEARAKIRYRKDAIGKVEGKRRNGKI